MIKTSTSSGGDLETLPQQALTRNTWPHHQNSTSSAGDLETLAQQALTYNCVVAAYIGNKDLETLTLQALQHDLMASSFTQSTVVQHSSQESTVLQARQPEAVLTWTTRSWGCCRAEMQFNTNERPQQAVRHNRGASSMGISISSGGDLETLPQQALPHNRVASSIKSSTSSGGDLETLPQQALPHNRVASSIKSSSSSCGDLQTLAQQGLQCNCVVPAYIGNEDLETLTLQALQHDLMASSLTERTIQSTVAQQSSQEATVLQARQPEAVLAWPSSSWGCRKAAIRYISILMRGPNKTSAITT
ncbi:LOW QUALITY PROTEIN: hypothetical protein AAY473_040775 [Plecturocebus cupreus]